ncbi:hypothetical protein [Alkalicoccobacillus porphyridii]|uniref:PilN domain-containing protein n=1 Tax=Alkalicoccobacillus porphyridii TaxID=2597270 RepID=A0A553ZXR0_9BACI|nr:hypothetical protein [Alkalicoccobacillus porphyridii]TSB46238.1 hypothetical protein FN960_12825 [Alkalicoccobacillus porphyridii]
MLPEINLLPERYKRDVTPLLIAALTLILILISFIVLLLVYANIERERTAAVNEAAELQLQKIELEAEAGVIVSDLTPEQQLQDAVNQLDEYRVPTSEFTAELIRLLPDRGYFIRYFYQRDGLLEVTVSFDQMQEAAHYYDELFQHPYVEAVRMNDIGTEAVAEIEGDEDSPVVSQEQMMIKPRYEATYEIALDLEQTKLMEEGESP